MIKTEIYLSIFRFFLKKSKMVNNIQPVRQATVFIIMAVICIILIYRYDNLSLLCHRRNIYKVSILFKKINSKIKKTFFLCL